MRFQPCASVLRLRNVFLSSATFGEEKQGVAFQQPGSSLCHEYRSRSRSDYPRRDVSEFFLSTSRTFCNNTLKLQVVRSTRQMSLLRSSGFPHPVAHAVAWRSCFEVSDEGSVYTHLNLRQSPWEMTQNILTKLLNKRITLQAVKSQKTITTL